MIVVYVALETAYHRPYSRMLRDFVDFTVKGAKFQSVSEPEYEPMKLHQGLGPKAFRTPFLAWAKLAGLLWPLSLSKDVRNYYMADGEI